MSVQVRRSMKTMARDGYFGTTDMRSALNDVRDGKGVTKNERAAVINTLADIMESGDTKVTQGAYNMFNAWRGEVRHYSSSKKIYNPNMDDQEYNDMLKGYFGGREAAVDHVSSGESMSTKPAKVRRVKTGQTRRASSGGESGGSRRRSSPMATRLAASGGE